jgi:hypothetical protein
MKFAFDIGGVISKEPDRFRRLIADLWKADHDIFILTDMHPYGKVAETLELNQIQYDEILVANYEKYGEMCKDVLLREHSIDFFFDDFIGYVAGTGAPIRLLMMPDATKPYWHDDWKTVDGDESFGRKVYKP